NGKVCREYVSRDRGNTWSLFTSDLSEGSPVGVGGHNQSILFGVASGGLVESNDGGKTWPAVAREVTNNPHSFARQGVKSTLFSSTRRAGPCLLTPRSKCRVLPNRSRREHSHGLCRDKSRTAAQSRSWAVLVHF